MSKTENQILHEQLLETMTGRQAHIEFDKAIGDFPKHLRGAKPAGAPHTAWELLEHMRIAQRDILEFSRDPNYQSPKWPEGYWPETDTPPDEKAWDASIKKFHSDAAAMKALLQDASHDLFRPFAHGEGQNLLRECLLVATHNSYHLGQLVYLKKTLLGTS